MSEFRSGFVAVIGRPNVGKSTLLNALVGMKISIVSEKPQTTRNRIQCVMTTERAQIVFLDTPGLHQPRHKLGEYMVKAARQSLAEVDAVVMVCDINRWQATDESILGELPKSGKLPVILAANKADTVDLERIEAFVAGVQEKYPFRRIIPISAAQGYNLDLLTDEIVDVLPEGPQYYPDDWVTDHPERFVAAEFIREQVLRFAEDEVPHAVAVDIDEMKDDPQKPLVRIRATIYVERDSQKGIIIGKNGRMLKKIGTEARQQLETLLGTHVFLDLWVKVKRDWRDKPGALQELGYN